MARSTIKPPARTVKRAVIYARISRDDTGDGTKIENQTKACRSLCDARGWEVVAVESDESISAYSGKDRPAWNAVLAMVAGGEVDIVVAWHIDRMTRSMVDLENLILLAEGHGVGVSTVTGDIDLTNETGQMVARILAAVARAEVQRKSSRQRLANRERAVKGQAWLTGSRPFGYEEDRVTIRDTEAEAIREAAVDVMMGWTLAAIARRWNDEGLTSGTVEQRAAKHEIEAVPLWTGTSVGKVLTNPRLAGIRVYQGEQLGEAEWEPILELDTHLALVGLLSDEGRGSGRPSGPLPETLLTGIAVCANCGGRIRGGNSHKTPAYRCAEKFCASVPRAEADTWVTGRVVEVLTTGGIKTGSADVEAARERLKSVIKRQTFLATQMGLGDLDEESWKAANVPLKAEIARLQALTARVPRIDLGTFSRSPEKALTEFLALPLDRQRMIVQTALKVELVGGVVKGRAKVPISTRVVVTDKRSVT